MTKEQAAAMAVQRPVTALHVASPIDASSTAAEAQAFMTRVNQLREFVAFGSHAEETLIQLEEQFEEWFNPTQPTYSPILERENAEPTVANDSQTDS